MKKFYYLFLGLCVALVACQKPIVEPEEPDPVDPVDTTAVELTEWELADSLYTEADWTIPSHTAFKVAQYACSQDPTEANLEAMRQKIKELVPKTEPYCMVATINGDPSTRMGFAWFTNDSVFEGEVQLVAKANATEKDFESAISFPGTPTSLKKAIRYTGLCGYIANITGLAKGQKYKYISHKALAENLTPGTEYSWRVGYEDKETHQGHWSPIAHFRTKDANQGEFSFIYMTDSHLMNKEYVDYARRCALAAVATVPEARFCVFPGDFVEDGTVANSEWEWERWFEESMEPVIKQMPIVPTDGNHDDSPNINYTLHFNTDNSFKAITDKPQFEGIIYSFVYGDALFLVYSMQDFWRESYDEKTYTWSTYLDDHVGPWFKSQVTANPNTKFRISLSHFNLFSGSDHSTDTEPPLFRASMLPVFKSCEIDLALQGHDHTYEVIGPVNPDDCTPILSAISDREQVDIDKNKNITGYKGGTYCTDDGTLYFIGATCGRKRYYPHSRERMDAEYEAGKHNIKNYFDLFTGMFGQPEAPSFTKVTVKSDCIEINSYAAGDNGSASLINTMKVVRTKEHSIPMILD